MMAYSRARGFRRDYIDARVHEGEAEGEKKMDVCISIRMYDEIQLACLRTWQQQPAASNHHGQAASDLSIRKH
jgi:hypothetical protein